MLLAGQKLSCKTAYEFGLVDEIVSKDNFLSRIDELCLDISNSKTNQTSEIKKMIP